MDDGELKPELPPAANATDPPWFSICIGFIPASATAFRCTTHRAGVWRSRKNA